MSPREGGPVRNVHGRRVAAAALSLLLVVGASGCRWRPPAASVNGEEISAADLRSDIDMLRDNPELASLVFTAVPPEGEPVPADLTAQVLTMRIIEPWHWPPWMPPTRTRAIRTNSKTWRWKPTASARS